MRFIDGKCRPMVFATTRLIQSALLFSQHFGRSPCLSSSCHRGGENQRDLHIEINLNQINRNLCDSNCYINSHELCIHTISMYQGLVSEKK